MLEKLAVSLGRNDEQPNIALAKELSRRGDVQGIKEIIVGLTGKDKAIANDCVKVLDEIGERRPELISGYAPVFLSLLHSKNNRLVWGCMAALACIAHLAADAIWQNLNAVITAYENGSVITVDTSMTVFAKLCAANREYEKTVFPILIKHLKNCRPKEVPQHAERASVCVNKDNAGEFVSVLEYRLPMLTPPQSRRVEKIIRAARRKGGIAHE